MLVQDIKLSLISLIVMMFCFMLVYYVYKWCFKKNTGADAAIMALISGSSTIGFLGFAVLAVSYTHLTLPTNSLV